MEKAFYYKTTYSKLEKALLKLKFHKKKSNNRIYVNDVYESVIAFPDIHGSKIVSEFHISSTFTNLYFKGIIKNEKALIKLL